MTTTVLAVVFLAIALASLTVQAVLLGRILLARGDTRAPQMARKVLIRTVGSRIAGDVLYVAVGVMALVAAPVTGVGAVVVFAVIKALWVVNSIKDDVWLRCRLTGTRPAAEAPTAPGPDG